MRRLYWLFGPLFHCGFHYVSFQLKIYNFSMLPDIQNHSDIKRLIDSFYDKVKQDDTIGYIFNDVAKVNWEHHLPIMYDFWEAIIFQKGNYSGNPMSVHIALNQRTPLLPAHFNRWKQIFL